MGAAFSSQPHPCKKRLLSLLLISNRALNPGNSPGKRDFHSELYLWEECIWLLSTDFPGGSDSKASAYNRETQVRSLGQEDPLEKEMATHSSLLAQEIPWTEEPGGLPSMGSHRVGHDWSDLAVAATVSLPFYSQPNIWLSRVQGVADTIPLIFLACSVVSNSLWPHGI